MQAELQNHKHHLTDHLDAKPCMWFLQTDRLSKAFLILFLLPASWWFDESHCYLAEVTKHDSVCHQHFTPAAKSNLETKLVFLTLASDTWGRVWLQDRLICVPSSV